jgi:hypothetical protein
MPKANQQPDSERRQTRPTNANAHPGKVAMERLAVRRKTEDIECEKKVRDERREAREKKKADARAAVNEIALFENEMALDDEEQVAKHPRRQAESKSGF